MNQNRKRVLLFSVLAVFLSLVFAGVVAEIAVRFSFHSIYPILEEEPFVRYQWSKLGYENQQPKSCFINSSSSASPVVIVGDSFVSADQVSLEERFYSLLTARGVPTSAMGLCGSFFHTAEEMIPHAVTPQTKVVVYLFYENDFKDFSWVTGLVKLDDTSEYFNNRGGNWTLDLPVLNFSSANRAAFIAFRQFVQMSNQRRRMQKKEPVTLYVDSLDRGVEDQTNQIALQAAADSLIFLHTELKKQGIAFIPFYLPYRPGRRVALDTLQKRVPFPLYSLDEKRAYPDITKGRIFGVLDGHLNRKGHQILSEDLEPLVRAALTTANPRPSPRCRFTPVKTAHIPAKPTGFYWVKAGKADFSKIPVREAGHEVWYFQHRALLYQDSGQDSFWLRRGLLSQVLDRKSIEEMAQLGLVKQVVHTPDFLCDPNAEPHD